MRRRDRTIFLIAAFVLLAAPGARAQDASPPPSVDAATTGTTRTLLSETLIEREGLWRPNLHDDAFGGWRIDPDAGGAAPTSPALRVVRDGPDGTRQDCLVVSAGFPGAAAVRRSVVGERRVWGEGAEAEAWVFVPQAAGPHPSAQLVARHAVWGWFATEPTQPLTPGEWTHVGWRLGAENADWTSQEDPVLWNDTMRKRLEDVGLRIFAKGEAQAEVRIAGFQVRGVNRRRPPLRVEDLEGSFRSARRGALLEIAFDLSRAYENPYDPDVVAVDVELARLDAATTAGRFGRVDWKTTENLIVMPAFYWQDFFRARRSDGTEVCRPQGAARWKARLTPLEAGPHALRIRVRDRFGDAAESAPVFFDVADAAFRGFVRVDSGDRRFFSFDDGSFFYPIGLIVRSPYDMRHLYRWEERQQEGLGTYAVDRYFTHMAEAGVNFTRVWMAAWWAALEWSEGYRRDYQGLGRYSQMNAWRLDHTIGLAERLGVYVDLTMHNHGQFLTRFDAEWADNPYSALHGGPLGRPQEFFTDEAAKAFVRRRLRYVVARWGYSPNVAFWELFNEVNLTESYDSEAVAQWHAEIGGFLRETDPYRHLVTTHYTRSTYDPRVLNLKEIEVAQSNAYYADMISGAGELWDRLSKHDAPAYMNEYGVGDNPVEVDTNFHSGLWVSSVTPFAGPALYWYWHYVDAADQYFQYEALERFHADEDYRGRGFEPAEFEVVLPEGGLKQEEDGAPYEGPRIQARGQRSAEEATFWLYDASVYRRKSRGGRDPSLPIDFQPEAVPAVQVRVEGLTPGAYRVEFWNTWRGETIPGATSSADANASGTLTIEAPPFTLDVACKVRPAQ